MTNINSMRRALEVYELSTPENGADDFDRYLRGRHLAQEVRSFLDNLTRENLNQAVSRAIYGEDERVTFGVDRIVNELLDLFEGVK